MKDAAVANVKHKILVVDDNESIRQLLEVQLTSKGFDVVCAEGALEAIRMFNEEYFDLVLTDICMPSLNGNFLARYICNTQKDVPVIALTANPDMANDQFNMVIEKPYGLKFLSDSIAYCLSYVKKNNSESDCLLCV